MGETEKERKKSGTRKNGVNGGRQRRTEGVKGNNRKGCGKDGRLKE